MVGTSTDDACEGQRPAEFSDDFVVCSCHRHILEPVLMQLGDQSSRVAELVLGPAMLLEARRP